MCEMYASLCVISSNVGALQCSQIMALLRSLATGTLLGSH